MSQSRKREILCALGIMGVWACAASSLQIDPPEAQLMTQKRVTLAMIGNDQTVINSRMHDGTIQSMIKEIVTRTVSGDLQIVVPEGLQS